MNFQIFILFILLLSYYFSPQSISSEYLLWIIVLIFLSLSSLWLKRRKTVLHKRNISLTLIFTFLFLIVNFQIPIDFVLGNDLLDFSRYFYDYDIVNRSVTFSALALVAFNIGSVKSMYKPIRVKLEKIDNISSYPLLILVCICFILFVLNINLEFIRGGHGTTKADALAMSFYVLYLRLSILYLSVVVYNKVRSDTLSHSLVSFFRSFSYLYWLTVVISVFLFLFAHNRVFIIYLLFPIIMGYVVYRRLQIRLFILVGGIMVVAFLATIFKIFDLQNMFSGIVSLGGNLRNLVNYKQFNSFSPFTVELAYSIYPNTVLFYLWDKGATFYGLSFIVGILKSIPGAVSCFMFIAGLDVTNIETGDFATKVVGSSYGLGSASAADMLINIGFYPTLLLFGLIGFFFTRCDISVFSRKRLNIYMIVSTLTIASLVVFIPRGSFFELIGFLLFNLLFIRIYLMITKKKKHEKNITYNESVG